MTSRAAPARAWLCALAAGLCACAEPVYFERASDGARSACSPSWTSQVALSRFDSVLRSCIADHLREGFVSAGAAAASGVPAAASPLAARTRTGSPVRPQPLPAAADPADRERRLEAAMLEAQIQSRARYLDERLTEEQRSALAPLLRSVIALAMSGAPEAALSAVRDQITARSRKLGLREDTRTELGGLLRDGSRLAQLGGAAPRAPDTVPASAPARAPKPAARPKSRPRR